VAAAYSTASLPLLYVAAVQEEGDHRLFPLPVGCACAALRPLTRTLSRALVRIPPALVAFLPAPAAAACAAARCTGPEVARREARASGRCRTGGRERSASVRDARAGRRPRTCSAAAPKAVGRARAPRHQPPVSSVAFSCQRAVRF
jgi:hypothetical protein